MRLSGVQHLYCRGVFLSEVITQSTGGSVQLFGQTSIAIYIDHQIVIRATLIIYAKQPLAIYAAMLLAGFDVLVAAVGNILHIFAERAAKRWLKYHLLSRDQSVIMP